MSFSLRHMLCCTAFLCAATMMANAQQVNLLLNPRLDFHSFSGHRYGQYEQANESHDVAFWNTDAWGDITVEMESRAPAEVRPDFSTGNLVRIAPGKRFYQFITLPEAGLAVGERVSLIVYGWQPKAGALRASVKLMKIDSEDGTWSPADFGFADDRVFNRFARGELVVARDYNTTSDEQGRVELHIDGAEIIGHFTPDKLSHSSDVNTVGLQVEFDNTLAPGAAGAQDAWVFAPCLTAGESAVPGLRPVREMIPLYRHIPRTIQKLWKGEPIHVIMMGASLDRASANPMPYLYDEDPNSPTFKQPIAGPFLGQRYKEETFDASLVGRPELDGYFGYWRHYFSYTGRLKLELMRKFDLGPDKLLFNWMALDGSSVGEAMSGLAAYASLSLAPSPEANGHAQGRTWQELYPDLFRRPEGTGPDLVIFGSGWNEKTDSPDEVAVFEGTIRWMQQHYPGCEFLFSIYQMPGGRNMTPNTGDLQALALRYGIPYCDYELINDQLTRWITFDPIESHPQAAMHYLWFKTLERAFETWDPIVAGEPQAYLPERVHPNTYGWEGEMVHYDAETSSRIVGNRFILDDTAFNAFAGEDGNGVPVPVVDGQQLHTSYTQAWYNLRNSWFRHGNLRLGDRHILEATGPGAKITFVDSKLCPNRRLIGVDSAAWNLDGASVTLFPSEWGAPFGDRQAVLTPGSAFEIDAIGTDISVAYVDAPGGGTLHVLVDGEEKLVQPANVAFTDSDGNDRYLENRKGILSLGYGLHTVRLEATGGPVVVLGIFTYDARPNRDTERHLAGQAGPGDVLALTPIFHARPVVITRGDLAVRSEDITREQVTFGGSGLGTYEIIGE